MKSDGYMIVCFCVFTAEGMSDEWPVLRRRCVRRAGRRAGGDALRRRRNMKGGVFPKKRNEIRRSAKVREGRSEGAKRRERCLEVGNDKKKVGNGI